MKHEDYPAFFKSADEASSSFQKNFLRLIGAEYGLLFLAAALAVPRINETSWHAVTAFILLLSAAVLLTRSIWKPEQQWYKARALSESAKTLTWRYMMRAYPFDKPTDVENKQEFRQNLARLMHLNLETVEKLSSSAAADQQVTAEMERVRSLPLNERRAYYQNNRVQEQREWYRDKAADNKNSARWWLGAGVVAYGVAIALSLIRIAVPQWEFWPVEPLIVLAGSLVGWVQIKKFNELAAAYGVTAQEIGMINVTLGEDDEVKTFSDFVNDAEVAFSREHTLWLARQAN